MNMLEAICSRRSRRSYLDMPIEPDKMETLLNLINRYNEEGNLSMQFVENGSNAFNGLKKSYGLFGHVRSIIMLKGKSDDPHVKEKCGYYGELIVLQATRMGLGTCWVGASFDRQSYIFNIPPDEEFVCVITIGHVAQESGFRENLIRKVVHGKAKPLEYFYTADSTPPQWFLEGIQSVQSAPSAVNRQKYHFYYKDGVVRARTNDNAPFGMVDLGIAKAHFSVIAGGSFDWGNDGCYMPA